MSKGKCQQVMEHNLLPLNFQLPGGKDILQTAERFYQSKLESFCKYYLLNECSNSGNHDKANDF